MKLFKSLFLILTLTSVLISCNKDEETHEPTKSELIVGTWELNDVALSGTFTTTVGTGTPIISTMVGEGNTFTDPIQNYTNDPKVIGSGSFVLVTTTTTNGVDKTEQKIVNVGGFDEWKIDGDKLTLSKASEDDKVYDIITLTSKVLKIKGLKEETTMAGGTTVKTEVRTSLTFEKK